MNLQTMKMEHYNKFVIEVETLDIKVTEYYQTDNGYIEEYLPKDYPDLPHKKINYLDLSHYSQRKSDYESEIRKLQQLAINEFLLLSPSQISQQLKRLEQIEKRCKDFWPLFQALHKDFREQTFEGAIILRDIERKFIVPKYGKGSISRSFLSHLHDAVMYKHGYISGFIAQIKKAMGLNRNEKMTKCKRYPDCNCFKIFEQPAIEIDAENAWFFVSCIKELEHSILALEWIEFENSIALILPYFTVVPETLHGLFAEKLTTMIETEMSWKMPKPTLTIARIKKSLSETLQGARNAEPGYNAGANMAIEMQSIHERQKNKQTVNETQRQRSYNKLIGDNNLSPNIGDFQEKAKIESLDKSDPAKYLKFLRAEKENYTNAVFYYQTYGNSKGATNLESSYNEILSFINAEISIRLCSEDNMLLGNNNQNLDAITAPENKFWKGIPMKVVIEHFKVLTERNSKNGKPFLTPQQFIAFIEKGFLAKGKIPKQRINLSNGEKGFVIKRFYEFFVLAVSQYSEINRKGRYIKLVSDCFSNWDTKSITAFFRPNKAKENW